GRRTGIILTGGLEEYGMDELSLGLGAGLGAGEKLTHHPSPGFVYKLVAIAESDEPAAPMRPVAKTAIGKTNLGGQKWAYREYDAQGFASAEHLVIGDEPPHSAPPGEPLQARVVARGESVPVHSIEEARAYHARTKVRLPPHELSIQAGPPALVARRWSSRVTNVEVAHP